MASKIGWIGTGVMGRSMCLHLRKAGYEVAVHNRSKDKAQDLLDAGAVWCDTPAGVADGSEAVFSIVGYPRDVEEVYLGSGGVLAGTASGSMVIDMTTSEPALAKRLHEQAAQRGVASLDAPVSGGDTGARAGTLAIMVGGDRADYDRAMPYFEIMGENIALMGPAGSGQHTKMSNQILIASTMIGVVESLLYGQQAGLDQDAIIDVIGKGAAACWSINNLGRRIVQGNFDPGFFIKHFVKDMGIALAEARAMNLALPGLALAHQFYVAAMADGLEDLGTHGLYKVLTRMNGAAE
jgi:3-hydroxyisobutyrate dehydrogenase